MPLQQESQLPRGARERDCVLHHAELPPELAGSFAPKPCLRLSHNTANLTHIHKGQCADP